MNIEILINKIWVWIPCSGIQLEDFESEFSIIQKLIKIFEILGKVLENVTLLPHPLVENNSLIN